MILPQNCIEQTPLDYHKIFSIHRYRKRPAVWLCISAETNQVTKLLGGLFYLIGEPQRVKLDQSCAILRDKRLWEKTMNSMYPSRRELTGTVAVVRGIQTVKV